MPDAVQQPGGEFQAQSLACVPKFGLAPFWRTTLTAAAAQGLCGTLAINRSSRTEVRFASLSGQSARLKPMLAGICFESIWGIPRIRDIPQLKI